MSAFDPGPGWRRWVPGTVLHPPYIKSVPDGSADVIWVREEPVSPLPTEPYTVIRVFTAAGETENWYLNGRDHMWWETEVEFGERTPLELTRAITGFEVLAEPRAVTAEAIAAWFADEAAGSPDDDWRYRASRTVHREFGAES